MSSSSSSASSSHNIPCSAVRFVESCTLIPHCSSPGKPGLNVAMKETRVRIPSIQSWTSSSRRAASDSGVAGACDTLDSSSDGVRLVLPRFRRASSSSSKSSSSAPTSPVAKPSISPILRTSSSHVPKRLRYPSLPVSTETETIPLRGCCPGCFAITEKAITDPCWVEKFSSGAQRLRGQSRLGHIHEHNHEHGVLDLSVDEVDKIRRSLDLPGADMSHGSSTARTQHLPCRSRPIFEYDDDEAELFPLPTRRKCSPPSESLPKPSAIVGQRKVSPLSTEIIPNARITTAGANILDSQPSLTRKVEPQCPSKVPHSATNVIPPHLPETSKPSRRRSALPAPPASSSASSSPFSSLKRYTSRDSSPEKASSKHKRHSSLSLFRSAGIPISTN